LAEVTLDDTTELGVEFNYISNTDPNLNTGTDFGQQELLQTFGGYWASVTGNNYSFLVRALQNEGRLEVLSRPQILTADNQEATINIGQSVPIVTGTRNQARGWRRSSPWPPPLAPRRPGHRPPPCPTRSTSSISSACPSR
jgi:type II secretory pathway component GspD/PulD (secretin)